MNKLSLVLLPFVAQHDALAQHAHGLAGVSVGGRRRCLSYRDEANVRARVAWRIARDHDVVVASPAWVAAVDEARALNTAPALVTMALAFARRGGR